MSTMPSSVPVRLRSAAHISDYPAKMSRDLSLLQNDLRKAEKDIAVSEEVNAGEIYNAGGKRKNGAIKT